jgi:hypothetical protein
MLLLVILQSVQPPLALQMAEQARFNLQGVRISWSELEIDPRTGATSDRSYRTAIALNGDMTFEDLGNSRGYLQEGGDGSPAVRTSHGVLMKADGESWQYMKGFANAMYWGDRRKSQSWSGFLDYREPRSLGLNWDPLREELAAGGGIAKEGIVRYEEEQSGSIHTVTVTNERGNSAVWRINADKGWNPEYIELRSRGGHELGRAEILLEQRDGVWFPAAVCRYSEGELVGTTVIDINVDKSIKSLSATDIGLEPGAVILGQEGAFGKQATRIWNGENNVTRAEWSAAVKAGMKERGPTIRYALEHGVDHIIGGTSGASIADDILGAWQRYVVRFIARHRLGQDQREKAWAIYRDCRGRGEQYLDRRKDALREVDALSRQAESESEKLAAMKAELRKPLDDIFETDLVPRLDKLLTRAQRERQSSKSSEVKGVP